MGDPNALAGGIVDEQFLRKYRQLLDAEDAAFDELEHAFEEGDRAHFDLDRAEWERCVNRRRSFLDRHGFAATAVTV